MNEELWKNIKGFPLYEISSFGNIQSWRNNHSGKRKNPKRLKLYLDHKGYFFVRLFHNGKTINKKIHRLVAENFITNFLEKLEVNHKDGNKQNNNMYNLEWATSSENQKHAYKLGLQKPQKGINHGRVKLTEEEVKEIIRLRKETDLFQKDIAKIFKVSQSLIYLIENKKLWKHL